MTTQDGNLIFSEPWKSPGIREIYCECVPPRTPLLAISHQFGEIPLLWTKLNSSRVDSSCDTVPQWYFQNLSEDFLCDLVLSGELRLPAGDGKEAFIDAEDIAEVAVAALTEDGMPAGNVNWPAPG